MIVQRPVGGFDPATPTPSNACANAYPSLTDKKTSVSYTGYSQNLKIIHDSSPYLSILTQQLLYTIL